MSEVNEKSDHYCLRKALERLGLDGYEAAPSSAEGVWEVYDADRRMVSVGRPEDIVNGLAAKVGAEPVGKRHRRPMSAKTEKELAQHLTQQIKDQVVVAQESGAVKKKSGLTLVTVQIQIGDLVITDARQVAQALSPTLVDALAEAVREKLEQE